MIFCQINNWAAPMQSMLKCLLKHSNLIERQDLCKGENNHQRKSISNHWFFVSSCSGKKPKESFKENEFHLPGSPLDSL